MPDSPISATPYEVLGVRVTATHDELRRAYRKLLRETHPDTGGDPLRFHQVQIAWERIGTPEGRAAYDRGSPARGSSSAGNSRSWETQAARPRQDTRPRARAYGHPGGWRRERFLTLMQEWVGRGESMPNPYDPALVRSAPREIRHILADALAEEATARQLAELGIGYTAWHDVATWGPEQKIDHIVLGPTGLFAILSEDYGGPVRVKRGELIGEPVAGERPMHELGLRAKLVARSARVRFSALLIVLPDDALDTPVVVLGSVRGATTAAVRRSQLPAVLRNGVDDKTEIGGTDLFEVRTRLQAAIRFV
ncbi:MAG: molecular chaperone DnaJ [Glaciihabitans sp.]|nr:molecular chaperone DnaJ [Glaciihabitans sp.]